jgi:hypothetical protein
MKRVTPMIPAKASDSDDAGFGALKTAAGLLPLNALEIEARIVGLAAETTLRQIFVNAFPEPLEAVYMFPLPPSAAVTHFTMTAHGRRVDGTSWSAAPRNGPTPRRSAPGTAPPWPNRTGRTSSRSRSATCRQGRPSRSTCGPLVSDPRVAEGRRCRVLWVHHEAEELRVRYRATPSADPPLNPPPVEEPRRADDPARLDGRGGVQGDGGPDRARSRADGADLDG